ncbi:MAG: MFS transporter [Clostridia bacterium]|nr:MFS transporter [Clostridia bacterium]
METKKLTNPKYMTYLLVLSWLVYTAGYIARLNYGAVMPEIIKSAGLSMTSAGFISTGGTIFYAFGQIISGILGDRFSPRYVMFGGIFTTSLCNMLMALLPIDFFFPVWCVNGLAQAMLWPPMLRIFTESYRKKDLSKMYVRVSTSNTVGTLLVYLLAFLFVFLGNWKLLFIFSSVLGFCVSFLWLSGMKKIESHRASFGKFEETTEVQKETVLEGFSIKTLVSAGIILITLATLLHGALKESVTLWMPTFIMDTFHLPSELSILLTIIMPIFSMLCLYLSTFLNDKVFKNEAKTSLFFFIAALVGSIGIRLFPTQSPILALLFGTIITSSMYGANLMLITAIPGFFSKYGKAATLTGFLNACAYGGTALSSVGIGALSDRFGWNASLTAWICIAGLGVILCAFSIPRWTKFLKEV